MSIFFLLKLPSLTVLAIKLLKKEKIYLDILLQSLYKRVFRTFSLFQ